MLGDKEEHFQGKGTEISALTSHIEEYLKKDGFTVQTSVPSDQGNCHSGEKRGGWLRDIVAADRALSVHDQRCPRRLHGAFRHW